MHPQPLNAEPQDPERTAVSGPARRDPQVKVALIAAAATIATSCLGVVSALVTGLLQYSGPGAASEPPVTSSIMETVISTATVTVTADSANTLTPSAGVDTQKPTTVSGKEVSLLHRVPVSGRVFDVGNIKVNGKPRKDSMSRWDNCIGNGYAEEYELDRKYRSFRAYVAVGDTGSDGGAVAKFAVTVDNEEPQYFNAKFGEEPTLVELSLVGENGRALRLHLYGGCVDYGDVNLVWIDPVVVP